MAVGRELLLHNLPKLGIDNGLVLTGIGRALVNDLAAIDAVLQHQIQRGAGKALAAGQRRMQITV